MTESTPRIVQPGGAAVIGSTPRVEQPEAVRMDYLGHCGFRFTTPAGSRIVVDPFRNWPDGRRWFLRQSPPVEADLLVITHPHFDHDAVDSIPGEPRLIDEAGEIRGDDYVLRTLAGRHARDFAVAIWYKNLIVVLESGGVRICLAADNQAEIGDELRDEIGPADLLTVAVDDEDHILDTDEATQLADFLGPKVVLPTHYLIEGLTDPESGLRGIKNWRASQAKVRDLEGSAVMITADGLPKEREGWVFASCVALEDVGGPEAEEGANDQEESRPARELAFRGNLRVHRLQEAVEPRGKIGEFGSG